MGAFRNPNFMAEFAYRTKWNYYTMRTLQENDKIKQAEYERKLDTVKVDMRERGYIEEDFYEVTQLINSMIGLLIFPEQEGYEHLSKNENDLKGLFPTIYKCMHKEGAFYSNYVYLKGYMKGKPEKKNPQIILRHLRNAASHKQISIFPESGRLHDNSKVIKAVVFKDHYKTDTYGYMEFSLRVPVNDLEPMLMEICDCIIKMTR